MGELIYGKEVYAIVGAAMEVYNVLGTGFLEPVYQDALAVELGLRRIPFEAEKALPVLYKGHQLPRHYRLDFLCFDQIIVELKALDTLTSVEEAQLLNYLKATGCKVGVLLNFGHKNGLQWRRMVL